MRIEKLFKMPIRAGPDGDCELNENRSPWCKERNNITVCEACEVHGCRQVHVRVATVRRLCFWWVEVDQALNKVGAPLPLCRLNGDVFGLKQSS